MPEPFTIHGGRYWMVLYRSASLGEVSLVLAGEFPQQSLRLESCAPPHATGVETPSTSNAAICRNSAPHVGRVGSGAIAARMLVRVPSATLTGPCVWPARRSTASKSVQGVVGWRSACAAGRSSPMRNVTPPGYVLNAVACPKWAPLPDVPHMSPRSRPSEQ